MGQVLLQLNITAVIKMRLGELFWDWGIPTVASLVEATQTVKIPVIASGGVRSGLDIAKSLALNARLTSVCQPVLQAAVKGAKETEELLSRFIAELRNFHVSCRRGES